MSRYSAKEKRIIALAYFHRYGWIVTAYLLTFISLKLLFAAFIVFSIWSFVGYKCKWKHIFCSYQNVYHLKMTPNSINWCWLKKSDAYLIPIIFFILGIVGLIVIPNCSMLILF